MNSKLILVWSIVLIFVIAVPFVYISNKKNDLENSVLDYLVNNKEITEGDIVSSDPFIANLRGDKNFMVSVKLKDEDKTYFYYKNE